MKPYPALLAELLSKELYSPVSYTHLDVYKRQILGSSHFASGLPTKFEALQVSIILRTVRCV